MYPRGLIIAICVGVLAGAVTGIIIMEMKTLNQLVFVDGSSISIVTEKTDLETDVGVKYPQPEELKVGDILIFQGAASSKQKIAWNKYRIASN